MAYGKAIELFLVNGTADSLVTAELSNWNGKAIKIPRTEVADCTREDIQGGGVYFLMCEDEKANIESVYIGEAENVHSCLIQHLNDYNSGKEKYEWNTAFIFIGHDLNKALIQYLRNRFVEIAMDCGRYTILTESTCKNVVLKESQIAGMEEFIDNVKVLMGAMGYRVLVPVSTPIPVPAPAPAPTPFPAPAPTPASNNETNYLICTGNNAYAIGFDSAGGFTVLKGSTISNHVVKCLAVHGKGYLNLRNALLEDGTIVNGTFTRDYEFKSNYAATTVVTGHMSHGPSEWKPADGTKLKDL